MAWLAIGAPEIIIIFSFIESITKFCLGLLYNSDNCYLFGNGKVIYKYKVSNKNKNFLSQFCLGSISNKSDCADTEKVSFKRFLNIHKHLMIKNSMCYK